MTFTILLYTGMKFLSDTGVRFYIITQNSITLRNGYYYLIILGKVYDMRPESRYFWLLSKQKRNNHKACGFKVD